MHTDTSTRGWPLYLCRHLSCYNTRACAQKDRCSPAPSLSLPGCCLQSRALILSDRWSSLHTIPTRLLLPHIISSLNYPLQHHLFHRKHQVGRSFLCCLCTHCATTISLPGPVSSYNQGWVWLLSSL